ncbi:LuxR C-terminal-related transcriptional regulator [Streptomyces sp. NBC_00648]
MLATSYDDSYLSKARRVGVRHFLSADVGPYDLIHAVRALGAAGDADGPVAPTVQGRGSYGPPAVDTGPGLAGLSAREREVLVLLTDGLSNSEIGARLYISPATAKDHISALLAKLRVSNRVQAAVVATRAGLTTARTTGEDDGVQRAVHSFEARGCQGPLPGHPPPSAQRYDQPVSAPGPTGGAWSTSWAISSPTRTSTERDRWISSWRGP